MKFVNSMLVAMVACWLGCGGAFGQDHEAVELGQRVEELLGEVVPIPRYYALVIGINKYRHWQDLRQAVPDAREVANLLVTRYGFTKVYMMLDENATRENIAKGMRAFADKLSDKDALLIFYAGHGYFDKLLNRGYWVPHEARDRIGNEPATTDWFSNNELHDYVAAMRARQILVVSDSCFSGTLFRGGVSGLVSKDIAWYRRALQQPSRWAISSGDLEQVPDESEFNRQFLNALQHPLEPVFSASDLAGRIAVELEGSEGAKPLFGRLRNVRDSQYGEFVFLDVASGAKPTHLAAALHTMPASLPESPENRAPAVHTMPAASTDPTGVRSIDLGGGVLIDLVWIEPGIYVRGSPVDEFGRGMDETQHQVTISKGFWMGKYEVMQEQWKTVMRSNPSSFEGVHLPVEKVSWHDCQEFLRAINPLVAADGGVFRLPTEAEWEYACRAGSKDPYAGFLDEMAWHASNSGSKTQPVGTKKPNAWGLHDMHGNVAEWCQDWYGEYPAGLVTDPSGAGAGEYRVFRGGGWASSANCRSASRGWYWPSGRDGDRGFRVVLDAAQ